MKTTGASLLITLISTALVSTAWANDAGLYEGVFDPNSSFIRVLAPSQTFASIDGTTVRDFEAGLSSYVNVMPGSVDVVMSEVSATIAVDPSKHYTVVYREGGDAIVMEDAIIQSPSKADILFYNLSDTSDLKLYVPLAKATAIDDVDAVGAKAVALKAPLTLDFEVRADSDSIASVSAVELKRKAGVSLVLGQTGDAYSISAVANTYQK